MEWGSRTACQGHVVLINLSSDWMRIMKIQNFEIGLAAERQSTQKAIVKQTSKTTTRPAIQAVPFEEDKQTDNMVKLSMAGLSRQHAENSRIPTAKTRAIGTSCDEGLDPRIRVLKHVIEMLTGKKIKLFSPVCDNGGQKIDAAIQQANAAQPDIRLTETTTTTHYSESESLSFSAFGAIQTTDGQSFSFNLEFAMSRSFEYTSQTSVVSVSANLKDPLVLNFSGTAAELRQNARINFDLDADGSVEEFSFVGPASGFLALDTYGNGSIKDGSQLFGTTSGNGFADLARFDEDGNFWIDENDSVYAKLMIWAMDEDGNQKTMGLKEANVGAIYLGNVNSQYSLKSDNNSTLGVIQKTGVFLSEDGKAHTIQHVDLAV